MHTERPPEDRADTAEPALATSAPRPHWKFDPGKADVLVSAERQQRLPAEAVLDLLEVGPGHVLADVGCGPGHVALPAARRVGPAGRVLAMDVSPAMLERLRGRLGEHGGPANLDLLLSEESRLPAAAAACDRLLLCCVIHELADPAVFFAEVARVLRPGGLGLIVEWQPWESPVGPPLKFRVPPPQALAWLRAASLAPEEPPREHGPYHYAIRFRRP
jgi:ubiquinone/menaquinone biosynthesis C-methylase UbiE